MPYKAFDRVRLSINYLKVWDYIYYSFLLIKSLLKGSRTDKLIDRSRTSVFVGYIDNTNTIHYILAPDLKAVIKAYSIKFVENVKGSTVDLKLNV